MIVDLISFSFKNKELPDANYIIDVRFLNNPFYVDELRVLTGLDKNVIDFFAKDQKTQTFLKELCKWIEYVLKLNKQSYRDKREKVKIAIGCTGGHHRSPYVVEKLAKYLIKKKLASEISIYHDELKKYNVTIPS